MEQKRKKWILVGEEKIKFNNGKVMIISEWHDIIKHSKKIKK